MKSFFFGIATLMSTSLCAQQTIDTTTFRTAANYNLAVQYYLDRIVSGHADHTNYFQVACYYALLGTDDSAFVYLTEAIIRGAKAEDVITDTDFNTLRSNSIRWSEINALLKLQYLKRNPGITKPDLGYELFLMGIEDQRYRTLKRNYKLPSAPVSDIELHNRHLDRLNEIIKTTGWPKYSEVGKAGGDAAFFVFQHSDAGNMKKVLPLMIAAAKAGEADLEKTAMMIDRYLAYTENVQIYGTQAFRKIPPQQNRNDIPLTLYPIAEEENLLTRRKAAGMSDFLENCRRLGVVYVPVADRADYKTIKIKKKWIDAGYILY
jgi:hypothetical protein